MKTKAIVIKCDKCGATDILKKVGEGPSQTTDVEGYETARIGWTTVVRYPTGINGIRHLCPKCFNKYSELFENFWKDGVEDYHD